MKRGDCGCRNHRGTPKNKYPSQDEALSAIFRMHVRHGPHRAYACPTMKDVWHITSQTGNN